MTMKPGSVIQQKDDDETVARVRDCIGEILWINRMIVKQNEKILDDLLAPRYVIDASKMKIGDCDV